MNGLEQIPPIAAAKDEMFFIWIMIAFFCLLLEIGNPGLFFFLSFFFGGLASSLLALVTDSLILQGACFLGVTGVAFLVLHRWVKKKLVKTAHHNTNIFAIQGKRGLVLLPIYPNKKGSVKIDGQVWSAASLHNTEIKSGELVEVKQVSGAHLIVEKV